MKLWEIIALSGLCVMLALAAIAFAWISSPAATWEYQMSGKTSRVPSHIESGLSLFAEEPAYLEELRQLKINAMTPLDALNYLDQLIKKVLSSGN